MKALLFLMVLSAAGCSTFDRTWRAAQSTEVANGLTGAWAGRWKSATTGHGGPVRCTIEQVSDGHYRAQLRTIHAWFFPFDHHVVLATSASNGTYRFRGHAELGVLAGGVCRYAGSATAGQFSALYRSKLDRGTIEMSRP